MGPYYSRETDYPGNGLGRVETRSVAESVPAVYGPDGKPARVPIPVGGVLVAEWIHRCCTEHLVASHIKFVPLMAPCTFFRLKWMLKPVLAFHGPVMPMVRVAPIGRWGECRLRKATSALISRSVNKRYHSRSTTRRPQAGACVRG